MKRKKFIIIFSLYLIFISLLLLGNYFYAVKNTQHILPEPYQKDINLEEQKIV